jgi:hypothetical protein
MKNTRQIHILECPDELQLCIHLRETLAQATGEHLPSKSEGRNIFLGFMYVLAQTNCYLAYYRLVVEQGGSPYFTPVRLQSVVLRSATP